MFYSKSTNGFYDIEIHGNNIPTDAVEITQELYQALFEGQATGKIITGDETGNPILIDPIPLELTYDLLRAAAYPTIKDQLDLLYHEGYDGWKSVITQVKDQYPKPNN